MEQKLILHCDLNNFFATASLIDKPQLQNKPIAIAGDVSKRHGIILAKNMPAKLKGVNTAEPIWQALQKCPDLQTLRPNYKRYIDYSNIVKDIYRRYTGNIEPFGIDEAWLDISTPNKDIRYAEKMAYDIKETIKNETGLTVSIGVSFSKIFAKLGSDYKKPDAVTVISKKNYRSFVWPMPIRSLLCVGKKTEKKLLDVSITTIGDLANTPDTTLVMLLGKSGLMLKNFANGKDTSFVKQADHAFDFKGIGNSMTTTKDLLNHHDVFSSFLMLSEMVSKRLMNKSVCASCICIELKDTELKKITRQKKIENPVFISDDIVKIAMELYNENWDISERPIRAIGIRATQFESLADASQVSFFDTPKKQQRELLELTKNEILKKYGKDAIKRASFIDKNSPKEKEYKEQHDASPLSFYRE